MNQGMKSKINNFITSNFGKIIAILLLIHILIGLGFLLYNRLIKIILCEISMLNLV